MKFDLAQILGLVQLGLSTYSQIHAAISAGKASITLPSGAVVSGAEAVAALDAAIMAALATGDAAADRIEHRV